MSDLAWVVNKGNQDLEIIDMDLKKWVILKPNRPQQVTRKFAMANINKPDFKTCNNPEVYFSPDNKLKHLIIRDAGIGDLLLLEPIIRELGKSRDITIKTKYQDIFKYHPSVKGTIFIDDKYDLAEFDCWDDLRSYSETAPSRSSKHRTDVYNEKFLVDLKDKEPNIYIDDSEKSPFKKQEGYKYFVIQCDASHCYRRYDRGEELAHYIINADPKNIVIILGGYDFVKLQKRDKRIIDLQGTTSVRDTIMILKECDYFIGGDSGLMHIACSLHTPAIGIFSIITPDFRLRYYTGPYKAITKEGLKCVGCGDNHMESCQFGNKRGNPKFISPCMDIEPKILYDAVVSLPDSERRFFKREETKEEEIKQVNIIKNYNGPKLTMPVIVQDESKNLPRFIELVMSHPAIGRVIAIDGGSKDNTVDLLTRAGAEVYVHPYDKTHPNMQAVQREYSTYFLGENENIIIFDIDEYMSKELWDYLPYLAECKDGFIQLSRRTFNMYEDTKYPERQIKQFPDWQPRVFCAWDHKYKWFRSPHHIVLNTPNPKNIDKPIIHMEAEGKNREQLEKQWSNMYDLSKRQYGF